MITDVESAELLPTSFVLDQNYYIGIVVWTIGFLFEAISDHQLVRFKSGPLNKEKVMTDGLWRYTRHPKYFGDSVQWWGFYILAATSGSWWTVPLLIMTILKRQPGVSTMIHVKEVPTHLLPADTS